MAKHPFLVTAPPSVPAPAVLRYTLSEREHVHFSARRRFSSLLAVILNA